MEMKTFLKFLSLHTNLDHKLTIWPSTDIHEWWTGEWNGELANCILIIEISLRKVKNRTWNGNKFKYYLFMLFLPLSLSPYLYDLSQSKTATL